MTVEIGLTLAILGLALVLFLSGRVRMDAVALLVLSLLALTGLLEPVEALSGFSNPAVVTVGAVFILSGGLARTGIASMLGRQLLRVSGHGEVRILALLMVVAGVLSGFMNNVGVAALLLPVVMDASRKTNIAPSRLLMPMAFACLLGGLTTLIGTPPNILASEALREVGLEPFGLFAYTPVGGIAMIAGILFFVGVGRHLLPTRSTEVRTVRAGGDELERAYGLRERLLVLRVPEGSGLAGQTLARCRIGPALDLQVVAVLRDGRIRLAPAPDLVLHAGDRLVAQGDPDTLAELQAGSTLAVEEERVAVESLESPELEVAEVAVGPAAPLVGRTLRETAFRSRYGAAVLAVLREGRPRRTGLQDLLLQDGDVLLVQGGPEEVGALGEIPGLKVTPVDHADVFRLQERLSLLRVPTGSFLVGKSLAEGRLGDAYGLHVLGILRDEGPRSFPGPDERIREEDLLLVEAHPEELDAVQALAGLEVEPEGVRDLSPLEPEGFILGEAVLAPRSELAHKSLRDLDFRRKYGLTVLAVWREGRPIRAGVRDLPLRFGDALLLHGPRERLHRLGREPDFIVLSGEAQEEPLRAKAPLAVGIMAAVLTPVLLGWIPISVGAVAGATAMVLTGCLTMEEAYRSVEWRAVFLIAGMLPLGLALDRTGTADLLAGGVVEAVGPFGPLATLATVFLVTAAGTQVVPPPALVVLMAPVVLTAAGSLEISPYPLMMGVALAAAGSFGSPISHPANILVMGPGGYRYIDYLRVGIPLTAVVFLVTLLLVPLVWPF